MSDHLKRFLNVHESIEGWFSPQSAAIWDALLQRQRDTGLRGNTMEIGVWHGKSGGLMLLHTDTENELCLLVDRVVRRRELDHTLDLLDHRPGPLLKYLGTPAETLTSTNIVKDGALSFRWIHIDGEHSGVDVCRNLDLADRLLCDRGVVCLDDFFSWRYPQITEAVFKYIRTQPHRFAMFLVGYNKAYLARPMYVHEYLEFCVSEMGQTIEDSGFETSICKTTWPADSQIIGIGGRQEQHALIGPDWSMETIRV